MSATRVWRCCISVPPRVGGREVHVHELSRTQAESGCDVQLLYGWGSPPATDGVSATQVAIPPRSTPASVHALAFGRSVRTQLLGPRRTRDGMPDYIHVHGDVYEPFALTTPSLSPSFPPVVVTVHGMPTRTPWARALWRWTGARRIGFIGVSSSVVRQLKHLLGPGRPIIRCSSGVRGTFFRDRHAEQELLVVASGMISRRRDFATIIRAAAMARSRPRVVIFGDGPDRHDLTDLAARLGVGLSIERSEDGVAIASALSRGVYVHACSSMGEGFPTSILEALACRTPILTPPFDSIADYLTVGVNCALYSDVTDLAEALDRTFAGPRRGEPTRPVPHWEDVAEAVDRFAEGLAVP